MENGDIEKQTPLYILGEEQWWNKPPDRRVQLEEARQIDFILRPHFFSLDFTTNNGHLEEH